MGIFENPSVWGQSAWLFLHCVTMTFPIAPTEAEKKHYRSFFCSLRFILPCKLCRQSYRMWMKNHPVKDHLHSRDDMLAWLIDMHNFVNRKLGKPVLSRRAALQKIRDACDLRAQSL